MSRQERWRGRGLRIERSSKRRIQRIHLNPRRFSEGAFREIVRYQIHSAYPREFVIAGAVSLSYVSSESLRNARRYNREERQRFLDELSGKMKLAENVIIQRPQMR